MVCSFAAETGVGACDDDGLAGEGVGGDGKLDEELAVQEGEAGAGTHGSCGGAKECAVLQRKGGRGLMNQQNNR